MMILQARILLLLFAVLMGCSGGESGAARDAEPATEASAATPTAAGVFEREFERIDSAAAAVDSIFLPVPLLTPAAEDDLRTFLSARHLESARELGIDRGLPDDSLSALVANGRLVRLEDTAFWVVGDLGYSRPLAIPGLDSLLVRIGERFHARLDQLGAPPFRFEISSALRSAEDQAALRRVNPNAASGESAHEYATSVDILYSAFSAPTEPFVPIDVASAPWTEPFIRRYAAIASDRVAARRALELKAILGQVLLELQREGRVLVTLERRQPVFHITAGNRE